MFNILKQVNIFRLWLIRLSPFLAFILFLRPSPSAGQNSPRLYLFNCGQLLFNSVESYGLGDDETDIRQLAAPCYLIQHEKGLLLWDGGLPVSLAGTEEWKEIEGYPGSYARMDRMLSLQLDEIGFTLDDIDYAAFSHTHFDHMGVANELEEALIIMQQTEYDAAFADSVTNGGFIPSTYENLRNAEFLILEGDHDIFGDGSVQILSTPGHTPGHQSLYVYLAETGPVVLSGDLYHFRFNREHRRYPVFNTDGEATLASMDRLEKLIEETGAQLWIQHDLELFKELRKAPLYYE